MHEIENAIHNTAIKIRMITKDVIKVSHNDVLIPLRAALIIETLAYSRSTQLNIETLNGVQNLGGLDDS